MIHPLQLGGVTAFFLRLWICDCLSRVTLETAAWPSGYCRFSSVFEVTHPVSAVNWEYKEKWGQTGTQRKAMRMGHRRADQTNSCLRCNWQPAPKDYNQDHLTFHFSTALCAVKYYCKCMSTQLGIDTVWVDSWEDYKDPQITLNWIMWLQKVSCDDSLLKTELSIYWRKAGLLKEANWPGWAGFKVFGNFMNWFKMNLHGNSLNSNIFDHHYLNLKALSFWVDLTEWVNQVLIEQFNILGNIFIRFLAERTDKTLISAYLM